MKFDVFGQKYFFELGKIVCFHGNHKNLWFYEIYSIGVISFLVSKVETQGQQQMDAFRRHYQMEGWYWLP